MKDNDNFEKKWKIIFLFMFIFIMLPLPFYFNTEYVPSFKGIPIFLIGWLIHALVTIVLIMIYAKQSLARDEYRIFEEEDKDE